MRDAVTVEGDRADRDLGSLRFFVAVHCSLPRKTVFSGLTRLRSSSCKVLIEAEHKGVYTVMFGPKCSDFAQEFQDATITLFPCPVKGKRMKRFQNADSFNLVLADDFVHFRLGCAP